MLDDFYSILPDSETGGVEQRPPINEFLKEMYRGTICRKDRVCPFGNPESKFELPMKFLVYLYDGFNMYKCIFDACHASSFSVGEEIGFTSKFKDNKYLIYKRHKIYNITKSESKERVYIMRPAEEIDHLFKKANKRYDEIKFSLSNHPPVQTAVALRAEKSDLIRLLGMLTYAKDQKIIEHPDVDPRISFKGCQIVTRYLGKEGEDFNSLLERSETRMKTVAETSNNTKEGEEFANLRKFVVILKWILDKAQDTDIGLNFGWGIFGKKIQDDFKLKGISRDEYRIPARANESKEFLMDKITKNQEKIKEQEQDKRLEENFPFLKKVGGISRLDKRKK